MIELTFTPIQPLLTVLLLLIAIASLRLFRNKLLYRAFLYSDYLRWYSVYGYAFPAGLLGHAYRRRAGC